MMTYTIITDSSGNGVGAHVYTETPASLPANEIACTESQAQSPLLYRVVNGVLAESLPVAQATQVGILSLAYQSAIAADVSFTTAAGVAQTYQADPVSVANLTSMLLAFPSGTPSGFYWLAADNTQVTFTHADLQGLAAAMGAQGNTAFQHLQSLKAQVRAATTPSAVQAVTW